MAQLEWTSSNGKERYGLNVRLKEKYVYLEIYCEKIKNQLWWNSPRNTRKKWTKFLQLRAWIDNEHLTMDTIRLNFSFSVTGVLVTVEQPMVFFTWKFNNINCFFRMGYSWTITYDPNLSGDKILIYIENLKLVRIQIKSKRKESLVRYVEGEWLTIGKCLIIISWFLVDKSKFYCHSVLSGGVFLWRVIQIVQLTVSLVEREKGEGKRAK